MERIPRIVAASMARAAAGALRPPMRDNFEPLRHPDGPPALSRDERREAISWVWRRRHDLQWLADTLADDASVRVLAGLLAFRVAGQEHAKIGVGRKAYEELQRVAEGELRIERKSKPLNFDGWMANRYDLRPLGIDLRLDTHPLGVVEEFLLHQYRHPIFEQAWIRAGDRVIDGGACWGDTALQFADAAGPEGRVVSFEVLPSNIQVFESNLGLNPHVADRIVLRQEALWDEPLASLPVVAFGPGTAVGRGEDGSVPARTLDSLVADGIVDRMDFIKLDIEGAEGAALRGAADAIARFRPRIAVAVYHGRDDLVDLPRLLAELAPGYAMALGHNPPHGEETVLFGWPAQ
jgi:FkbM family methyltransferase